MTPEQAKAAIREAFVLFAHDRAASAREVKEIIASCEEAIAALARSAIDPDLLQEVIDHNMPVHSSGCAAQDQYDDTLPCFCGTAEVMERAYVAIAAALARPAIDPERLARAWEKHRDTDHHPESTSGCAPRCQPAIIAAYEAEGR